MQIREINLRILTETRSGFSIKVNVTAHEIVPKMQMVIPHASIVVLRQQMSLVKATHRRLIMLMPGQKGGERRMKMLRILVVIVMLPKVQET
jgi:hypothetical protein